MIKQRELAKLLFDSDGSDAEHKDEHDCWRIPENDRFLAVTFITSMWFGFILMY